MGLFEGEVEEGLSLKGGWGNIRDSEILEYVKSFVFIGMMSCSL